MSEPGPVRPEDAPLNPALKSTKETVYDTTSTTPTPFDTASSKENEGEGWPVIWLVVTAISIIAAIIFLF
jgi:hypothetical protein